MSRPPLRTVAALGVAASLLSCSGDDAPVDEPSADGPLVAAGEAPPGPDDDGAPLGGAPGDGVEATNEAGEQQEPGTETACETVARVTEEWRRTAPTDHGDREVLAAYLRDQVGRYEELASAMATIGHPRDATRARILREAANTTSDFATLMADLATTGRQPSAEEREETAAVATWLENVELELLFWQANTCDDVPGVTRGETNGIPHVHVEHPDLADTTDP